MNLIELLGQVQNGGGLLILMVWLVITVWRQGHDFRRHSHDSKGGVFIKMRATDE